MALVLTARIKFMKKIFIAIIIPLAIIAFVGYAYWHSGETSPQTADAPAENAEVATPETNAGQELAPSASLPSLLASPISRARERVTKKPFGIYITPADSPVQPEKFTGFHTGEDFETFASEQGVAVPIFAICAGKIVVARMASGYGGVVVQQCQYNGDDISVVYGHIALSSVARKIGDFAEVGEAIAVLGEAGKDTDNERKHLHLGIKKGAQTDLRGYVASQSDLDDWLDPAAVGAF